MIRNIDQTAIIHEGSHIHPSVKIGSYSIIYSGVTVHENVTIGDHSIIGRVPTVGKYQMKLESHKKETIIESGNIIGSHVIIYVGSRIGKDSYLADKCFIREDVTIDDSVVIGTGVIVSFNAKISSKVKIMTYSNIGGNAKIGKETFIGAHVCSVNDNTPFQPKPRSEQIGPTIGERVFVGSNSTILPGIHIESDNTIGAGAVVTKSICGKHGLYTGIPAKKVNKTKSNTKKI